MAGKRVVRGSAIVAYALDQLSKNALADIVLDLVQGEIGDGASDEAIFERLQPAVDTVTRLRGDKPVNLAGVSRRLARHEARYLSSRQSITDAVVEEIRDGGAA